MSEALCQCGHAESGHGWKTKCASHSVGCDCRNWCRNVGCPCTAFTPPPTREPIRLTEDESEELLDALVMTQLSDYAGTDLATVKRAVEELVPAVESILAARLAAGPTLADAADNTAERKALSHAAYVFALKHPLYVPDTTQAVTDWLRAFKDEHYPHRTPESEDTE